MARAPGLGSEGVNATQFSTGEEPLPLEDATLVLEDAWLVLDETPLLPDDALLLLNGRLLLDDPPLLELAVDVPLPLAVEVEGLLDTPLDPDHAADVVAEEDSGSVLEELSVLTAPPEEVLPVGVGRHAPLWQDSDAGHCEVLLQDRRHSPPTVTCVLGQVPCGQAVATATQTHTVSAPQFRRMMAPY